MAFKVAVKAAFSSRILLIQPGSKISMTTEISIRERKDALRKLAHANRNAQENKDDLSRRIVGAFMSLPEYAVAETVMFYIDVRSEVRTRHDLELALQSGKTIVIPWCNAEGELELFRLDAMDELEVGMYKILEPRTELRSLAEKQVNVESLDLIMVPGVGFDRRGGRMGHGKGYYDKLLQHARRNTPLVALAFECQVFDEIPVADHDIFMDKLITEDHVYNGRGRG
jgi:5-formyltetrahydrofolate cyclo-ligase